MGNKHSKNRLTKPNKLTKNNKHQPHPKISRQIRPLRPASQLLYLTIQILNLKINLLLKAIHLSQVQLFLVFLLLH